MKLKKTNNSLYTFFSEVVNVKIEYVWQKSVRCKPLPRNLEQKLNVFCLFNLRPASRGFGVFNPLTTNVPTIQKPVDLLCKSTD